MKIYPAFDLGADENYLLFLESVQGRIEEMLPSSILALKEDPEFFFNELSPLLPLLCSCQLKKGGNAFCVSVLSAAEYTHGIGRFLSDALSRQFIPGKIVELVGTRTLSFYFFPHGKREFLLSERWLMANSPSEIEWIEKQLPLFIEELRLTLLCIVKARHFLSFRSSIFAQTPPFPSEIRHLSTFEEMHRIVQRLSAENTLGEIRNTLLPFSQRRSKIFDRDLFEEIKKFLSIYSEKFIGQRTTRSLARLICYHFYFQKRMEKLCLEERLNRHLLIKVFREKEILCILIVINLLKGQEALNKDHLLEVIEQAIPGAEKVQDAFLTDTHANFHPFVYLEIHKKGENFTHQEMTNLRRQLPFAIKSCIRRTVNPLFMLRNEEDQMRHLVALSREIHYSNDIPQIVISFEEQTEDALLFSVIIVRVLKKQTKPLKTLLSNLGFQISLREHKTLGKVRKKYLKEGAIFRVNIPKNTYIRRDHSLDLPTARQDLLHHLKLQFQEVRDYNGGLLSKQIESLLVLKELIGQEANYEAFILENYFFSIEPISSQMTLSTERLRQGFYLLLNLIETNTSYEFHPLLSGFTLSTAKEKQHLLLLIEKAKEKYADIFYSLIDLHDRFYCILFLPEDFPITFLSESFLKEGGDRKGLPLIIIA